MSRDADKISIVLANHEKEIIKALFRKVPTAWTLKEAKIYQQWAWEEERNGKICAELLEIGYENCKLGLKRYNLYLRKSGKMTRGATKWTPEVLENIINIRKTTDKNFKQIADELGHPYKIMYSALKRKGMLTPDVQRPLTKNKKAAGFALDAHLGNVQWNSKNALFNKIIKSKEDFGTLGRPG